MRNQCVGDALPSHITPHTNDDSSAREDVPAAPASGQLPPFESSFFAIAHHHISPSTAVPQPQLFPSCLSLPHARGLQYPLVDCWETRDPHSCSQQTTPRSAQQCWTCTSTCTSLPTKDLPLLASGPSAIIASIAIADSAHRRQSVVHVFLCLLRDPGQEQRGSHQEPNRLAAGRHLCADRASRCDHLPHSPHHSIHVKPQYRNLRAVTQFSDAPPLRDIVLSKYGTLLARERDLMQ